MRQCGSSRIASIRAAVRLLRDTHVGDLVAGEPRGRQHVPVSEGTRTPLISTRADEDLIDVVERKRAAGVRRIPVVNAQGGLEGILAMDDVLESVAGQTRSLPGRVRTGQQRERVRSQGH